MPAPKESQFAKPDQIEMVKRAGRESEGRIVTLLGECKERQAKHLADYDAEREREVMLRLSLHGHKTANMGLDMITGPAKDEAGDELQKGMDEDKKEAAE